MLIISSFTLVFRIPYSELRYRYRSVCESSLDISPCDGRGVDSVWVGDSDFRVQDAFEVVVGVVRLELPLVDSATIFIGQIAQIRSFADVETKLEGLALKA